MPIYEYICKDCGGKSEFLVGVAQEKVTIKCSHCESENLEKILSKSYVSKGEHFIGNQAGKTCCGRDERCSKPPCSDDGICKR